MSQKECIVCAQEECNEQRCQDILKAIEEMKFSEHSIEQVIKDLWP